MNKKLKAIIIIEIFIVLGLIFHVVHTPHMWIVLALAIVFTILANRSRARFFRILSFIFWAISAMILFTAGWFWLAVIFPAIMCIIFWKNNPRMSEKRMKYPYFQTESQHAQENFASKTNGNDVIDLYDIAFKPSGNYYSIKKMTGNTKIIVPHDVGIILDAQTQTGLIKIFDEPAKINAGKIRYFSENIDEVDKQIKIDIRVETGNIEVIEG